MGPTFNLIKKNNKTNKRIKMESFSWTDRMRFRREVFLKKIYLFFSFSDLRKSDCRISSGQTRKVLYVTRATCGNQKHGISPRSQVKIRKNPSFLFFSNLRRSTSPVISDL